MAQRSAHAAPVTVWLHGFAHTTAQFSAPSFGPSARPPSALSLALPFHQGAPVASFEAAVGACWQQVDAVTEGPVVLVGYSLGARLAFGMALARHQRVRRLVAIGGHPGLKTEAERARRRAADAHWQALLRARGTAAFLQAFREQPLFGPSRPEGGASASGASYWRARERLDANALADAFEVLGLAAMPDHGPQLSTLPMPVDFIAGEHDAKFRRLGEGVAAACQRGTLSVAPGAHHDVIADAPAWLASQIVRTLRCAAS